MKRSLAGILAAVALVGTVGLTGPAVSAKATITATGSSFANGLMQACKTDYSGADLTYSSTASGTGRTSFASKSVDFGMSDGVYTPGTQPANFNYVPILGGPVAIVVNIPTVKKLNLTGDLIGQIFTGKITKWNDAQIAKFNKGVKLPSLAIQPVYRSGTSGTNENLTGYLAQIAGNGWVKNSAFTSANKVVGTSAASSTVEMTTVKNTAGAIGYGDLFDAEANGLSVASVMNGAGQFIKPDVRSAKAFLGVQYVGKNGVVTFDYKTPVKGAYAISLVSYALVYKSGNPLVKGFLDNFIKSCAPRVAAGLSFVAVDGKLKQTALDLLEQ